MEPREITIPFRGVTDVPAHAKTSGDYAPFDGMVNFLVEDDEGRMRGGSIIGVKKALAGRIGSGPVQALKPITRASAVSGQMTGDCTPISGGTSIVSTGAAGQVWGLDGVPSLNLMHYLDMSPSGPFGDTGPNNSAVQAIAISPDGSHVVAASNYSDGTNGVARLVLINRTTQQRVGASIRIAQTGVDRFVNTVAMTANRVYVTTNQYVNVYAWSPTGGLTALSQNAHNLNGWADEAIEARLTWDGRYLFVAFLGSGLGVTLTSGIVVLPGTNARHWRSGVACYEVLAAAPYLRWTPFGAQLPPSDDYFEGSVPHNYFRFSEHFDNKPCGCVPTGLAVGPNGEIAVTHTNAGRGPEAGDLPGGIGYIYRNVTRIAKNGVRSWSTDSGSKLEDDGAGNFNDIPDPSDPNDYPTLQGVVFDDAGHVYVSGSLNLPVPDGVNVFKFNGTAGIEMAKACVGATSPQAGIAVHNGQIVVVTFRNDTWDGASPGDDRHLFILSPDDLDVVASFDLGADVSGLCVAAANGALVYGTDKV